MRERSFKTETAQEALCLLDSPFPAQAREGATPKLEHVCDPERCVQ